MKKILLIPSLLTVASAPVIALGSCGNEKVEPKDIVLDKTSISLKIGDISQLVATIKPEKASQELEWTSSNEKVARVGGDGLVTAIGAGTAKITVKPKGYDITATCAVSVLLSNNISLNQYSTSFCVGYGAILTKNKTTYASNQNYLFDITYNVQAGFYKGDSYWLAPSEDGSMPISEQFDCTINKIYVNEKDNTLDTQYYDKWEGSIAINNTDCPQMKSLINGDHIYIDLNITHIEQKEFYWAFFGGND